MSPTTVIRTRSEEVFAIERYFCTVLPHWMGSCCVPLSSSAAKNPAWGAGVCGGQGGPATLAAWNGGIQRESTSVIQPYLSKFRAFGFPQCHLLSLPAHPWGWDGLGGDLWSPFTPLSSWTWGKHMAEGEHQQNSLFVAPLLQTKTTRYGQKRVAGRDLFQSYSSFIH